MRYLGHYPDWGLRFFHSFDDHPLPELSSFSHVGEMRCDRSRQLPAHTHRGVEICYVAAGRLLRHASGTRYVISPGEFFISHPGESHGGGTDPAQPCHYFSVGFDPEQVPLAALLPGQQADPDRVQLEQPQPGPGATEPSALDAVLAQRVIPGGRGAEGLYRRMLCEMEGINGGDATRRRLAAAMIQTQVLEMLILLMTCQHQRASAATAAASAPPPRRSEFLEVVQWLATRLSNPPTLAEMARRAGLSPAHFCMAFKRDVGASPMAFLTQRRLAEGARRLATDGRSVQEVARALGFPSAQYFAYVFRKHYRCTPSQWRTRHGVPA